jgi:hypothetical protein
MYRWWSPPPAFFVLEVKPDAWLAALAIEHGLRVEDRNFTRFPGLRWRKIG